MSITITSAGFEGTISSSNNDIFITTQNNSGSISIGTQLELTGSKVIQKDFDGNKRSEKEYNTDGSVAEKKFDASTGKVTEENLKVPSEGKEYKRSGSNSTTAGSTDNQIEFQQNSSGAFISVSGSSPGFNVINADRKSFRLIRETQDQYIDLSNPDFNLWTNGIAQNDYTSNGTNIKSGSFVFSANTSLGNAILILSKSGDVRIPGKLYAQEYHTEMVSSSVIFSSGSTMFGNSADDLHIFTGDLSSSGTHRTSLSEHRFEGDISSSGTLTAISMSGDGSTLTGVTTTLPSNVVSSSLQLSTTISGSFTSLSSSLANRIVTEVVQNASTASFVVNSQTGSFTFNNATSSILVRNTETGSLTHNAVTASILVRNTETGSFVVNSQTGSFLTSVSSDIVSSSLQLATSISGSFTSLSSSLANRIVTEVVENSSTASFVQNSATASILVRNTQTGSFVQNSVSSSILVRNTETGSFVQNSVSSSILVRNTETGSFVVNSQTGSFLTSVSSDIISSSTQIANNISGSFNAVSTSLANRLNIQVVQNASTASFVNNAVTASILVRNTETGSFVVNSQTGSFLTSVSSDIVSSSLQLSTTISGSFVALSSSVASRTAIIENSFAVTGSDVTFSNITADKIITTQFTSSFITSSTIQTEGSNEFGDTLGDTHKFIGHITASGEISSSDRVIAKRFNADGDLEGAGGYAFRKRDDTGMYESGFTVGILAPENVQINIDSNNNDPDISDPSQFVIVHNNETLDQSPANPLFQVFEDGRTLFSTASLAGVTITHASGDISASGDLFGVSASFDGPISATDLVLNGSGIQITTDSGFEIEGLGSGGFNFASPRQIFLLAGKGRTDNADTLHLGSAGVNSQFVLQGGHITASGNISASGTLIGGGLDINGTTTFNDNSITNVNQIDLDGFRADAATNVQVSLGASGVDVVMEDGDAFTINSGEVDADFTYFDSGEASLIHGDALLSRVGISDTSPVSKLDVGGDLNVQSHITASGDISASGTIKGGIYHSFGNILGTYHGGSDAIKLANSTDKTELRGTNITISGPVTASGDISSSGVGTFASLDIAGAIDVDGTSNLDTIDVDGPAAFASRTVFEPVTFSAGDTTPDVRFGRVFKTNNGAVLGGANITGFDNGVAGQIIHIIHMDNITDYTDGTNLQLYRGFDLTTHQTNDTISFVCVDGTKWVELGRSDNT